MPRINHRQRIHDIIRDRILRGEVGSEDRLVDTATAAEIGVSRMPLREALMQLVSEGYLESTTRGFTPTRLPPALGPPSPSPSPFPSSFLSVSR